MRLHDFGTTFKAYRREVLDEIDLHGQFHRFIPALAARAGAAIAEVPVRHRPRASGRSHYGLSRVPRVAVDLVRLWRMMRRPAERPRAHHLPPYAVGAILARPHAEPGVEKIGHG